MIFSPRKHLSILRLGGCGCGHLFLTQIPHPVYLSHKIFFRRCSELVSYQVFFLRNQKKIFPRIHGKILFRYRKKLFFRVKEWLWMFASPFFTTTNEAKKEFSEMRVGEYRNYRQEKKRTSLS
jgi:hypothetical protein